MNALHLARPEEEADVSGSNRRKRRGTQKSIASDVLLIGSHHLLEKNSLTVHVEKGPTHVDLKFC